jgi:V/A-type H+-transporting ATPase subunit E
MPIDQIKNGIVERGDQELAALRKSYEDRISSLTASMEKQMAEFVVKQTKLIEEDSKYKAKSILDSANLEAKRILNAKFAELLEEGLSLMAEQIKLIRELPVYVEILNKMVSTAVTMLGKDSKISVMKADISRINDKDKLSIEESDLDGNGGIRAQSRDGKIELDLTLSALLSRVRENLIQEIYQRIR